ncbi:MAG: HD domain-containing protein [Chitinophagaceae bacterium]|nr:HD domain-containing protein [Chitinophagaceae bacterium]
MAAARKIINDPVHGFITIDDPLILDIIAHPCYQRLRRIYQMAFAHLVYPGAVHTRLHHSLGAYHLMRNALAELRNKGVHISEEEDIAAKAAILLHDAGHGPYSHALEKRLVKGVTHEQISVMLMHLLNKQFKGQLQMAIEIQTNRYEKKFLHQLVSGQLDVDRMDYLTRDSFFTGVAEGVIGHDRIIKMLTVHKGELMIEEKGIYTVEKFLVARRLMYWQVYLHKTVLSAEMMLVKIIERAQELIQNGTPLSAASAAFDFFLKNQLHGNFEDHLEKFCCLDDTDVMFTIKNWYSHPDRILSILCKGLTDRRLLKVNFQAEPFDKTIVEMKCREVANNLKLSFDEASYLVFTGEAANTMYNPLDERIKVLYKDGHVSDISQVENALIHQQFSSPVKKYYLCYLR